MDKKIISNAVDLGRWWNSDTVNLEGHDDIDTARNLDVYRISSAENLHT